MKLHKFAYKLKVKGYKKFAQQIEQSMPPDFNQMVMQPEPYRVWDTDSVVVEPSDISTDQELDQFLDVLYEDLQMHNPEYAEYLQSTTFGIPVSEKPIKINTIVKPTTAVEWYQIVMQRAEPSAKN